MCFLTLKLRHARLKASRTNLWGAAGANRHPTRKTVGPVIREVSGSGVY